MPSVSEKQRKFMGADLQRAREGEKTETGMDEDQLKDFASKPIKNEAGDDGDPGDETDEKPKFGKAMPKESKENGPPPESGGDMQGVLQELVANIQKAVG